ncbi:MAG: hypothetical protein WBD07_14840 [Vicinamibacterales bacterium]
MHQALTAADLTRRSDRSRSRSRRPRPIVLWHLRGATDDLRGLVVETSFGYALGLELDAELVSLQLHVTLEGLVADAERLEAVLIAQGWQVVPDAIDASPCPPTRRSS